MESLLDGKVELHGGDCLGVLPTLAESSIDACLTDPPYHLVSIVKRFGKEGAAPAKSDAGSGVYKRTSAGFMGKLWDGGDVAFDPATWRQVLRVLKPGAHLAAFAAPKNAHRLTCAIEDAGFEIRDVVMWLYGQGFPKSHDVSKSIDKMLGAEREVVGEHSRSNYRKGKAGFRNLDGEHVERGAVALTAPGSDEAAEWQGWGTALKPAYEPIILARKPLIGSVAENVLAHGTGALNIDGCRVPCDEGAIARIDEVSQNRRYDGNGSTNFAAKPGARRPLRVKRRNEQSDANRNVYGVGLAGSKAVGQTTLGRWPANVAHDGSAEVVDLFPQSASGGNSVKRASGKDTGENRGAAYGEESRPAGTPMIFYGDEGSAARFFYCAKATQDERIGSKHPTVKPIALMRWLARMICRPGGVILDPFAGTGTTAEAAICEKMWAVLIEREADSQADIKRRLAMLMMGPQERKHALLKARGKVAPFEDTELGRAA